ncbi:MAG: asparagine synthase-related protein, partial [Chitinophagaceae bacterium]
LDSQNSGCVVADPTADIRLMEYCFSIPDELFNFHGKERFIYKKLMMGRLPDFIVMSNKVYPQAYNAGEKLKHDESFSVLFTEIMDDESLSSFVDFSIIKQSYLDAMREPTTVNNVIMVDKFLKQISLIEFLRKNPNFIK